jgi:hypothetical protein
VSKSLLFRQAFFSQHEHSPRASFSTVKNTQGADVIEIVDDEAEEDKFIVAFQRKGFKDIKSCKIRVLSCQDELKA